MNIILKLIREQKRVIRVTEKKELRVLWHPCYVCAMCKRTLVDYSQDVACADVKEAMRILEDTQCAEHWAIKQTVTHQCGPFNAGIASLVGVAGYDEHGGRLS